MNSSNKTVAKRSQRDYTMGFKLAVVIFILKKAFHMEGFFIYFFLFGFF